MGDLISNLRAQFDYVIIDAPPVLVVTDAALIAKDVGGALMVTAVGGTRRDALSDALGTMERIDARVLGIVMTMVPTKGADSYGYAAYTYGSPAHEEVAKANARSGTRWQKPGSATAGGAGTIVGNKRQR